MMFIILVIQMYGCRPQSLRGYLCNFPKVVEPVNGGADFRTQQRLPKSALLPIYLTASRNLPKLGLALD